MTLLKKFLYFIVICSGIFFLFLFILAFTTAPFWAYYNLGLTDSKNKIPPKTIIMLGGGGFPSESNFIRAYYLQHAANSFPNSSILLALPGDTLDSTSSIMRMKSYLAEAGIDPSRLRIEAKGRNTRGQILNIAHMLDKNSSILVITSPEHMKRSVLCFRKAGFTSISGSPAFENAIEADLDIENSMLGGRKIPGSKISDSEEFRYQFWTQLKYEIIVIREYFALTYYKLKGWI